MIALKTIELRVSDYMSPGPLTIQQSDSLINAIDLMADKGIGNLVVKNKHAIGILTEREILEHLVSKKKIGGAKIDNISLSAFTIVSPETSVIDAARIMLRKKTRLLVYEDKKLVGIITATDMVRAFRRTRSNPTLEKVVSNDLYMVKDADDIFKAVKMMHDRKIGSVIVTKHSTPYGIFTERDLLVNVLSYDADLRNPVVGYCSHPLVTTKLGIGGSDAARIMAKNEIKRLILTKNGKVSSIVTARDIVDAFQSSFSDENL